MSDLSMTSGAIAMRKMRQDPRYNEWYKEYWQTYVTTENGWKTKTIIKLRDKCRKLKLEFNITKEDLELPSIYPVLGIPLTLDRTSSRDDRPSVDRIDPSKGYIKGNIKVISGRANRIKSDASKAELRAILSYVENNL